MENFKIYRNGNYSVPDNMKRKLKLAALKAWDRVDYEFTKPLK